MSSFYMRKESEIEETSKNKIMCKNLSSSMFAKKMKRTIILKNLEEKKLQIKKSKIIMSFLLKKKKKIF